ncbi:MAG: amidohydrolase family protein [Gemmatimonadales bacterium]
MIRGSILSLAALASLTASAAAQTVAITNGTVYPVSGPKIERGTVIITNGRIAAVGAGVAVPAGATVVDAAGKWVTPGLVHSDAAAGTGIGGLQGFGEASKQGEINPSFDLTYGIDPEAISIPLARTGGITTGILLPNGSFLPGVTVAVDYAGSRVDDMIVKAPSALLINLTGSARGAGGGSRAGAIARLKALFRDALEYNRRRLEYNRAATQPFSAPVEELAALLPALRGEVPVVIAANRLIDIENALRLGREYKLRVILLGAVEGWKVAPAIAAAKVPVIVGPNQDIPSFEGLGARLDNITLLREAGATVVIAGSDPGGERGLRFAAGNAVRNGLSWDDALKAVTLWPAQAFGLPQYGSLAVGAVGNIVVWSGDPFEFSSAAEKVFIRGKESSLKTRETELRDRYMTVPPVR